MRRDIFIVGVRILGIWQLINALNTFATLVNIWIGYTQATGAPTRMSYFLHLGIQLFTGLFLVFRTEDLFTLLDQLSDREPAEQSPTTAITAEKS
jgi:hypothetical protein